MSLTFISAGAHAGHNEDWAGCFHAPARTDLVIIDGATPVAQQDYVDPESGDVVWFVRSFAAALGACIEAGLNQHGAVHAAVDAVFAEFRARTMGRTVPQYAWPIAAMSWARVEGSGAATHLELYCLGDCKVLLRDAAGAVRDLDPWVNPQEAVVRAEIARLQAQGVLDAGERLARLVPLLRERRVYQNTVTGPETLCLRPRGGFKARRCSVPLAPGSALLAMTDGFYRLVDIHGLHTEASLFAFCEERGLEAALAAPRRHEADSGVAPASVKRADDASAILWQASHV